MTSPTKILSESSLGQKRISFFLDDKLLECWIESENPSLRIGEIHYARVTQIEELINRVFFKLNNGSVVSARLNERNTNIGDLEIITITAEERENKAGGYAIQGSASSFIPWINGSYTGTMGFPINEVNNLLLSSGWKKFND